MPRTFDSASLVGLPQLSATAAVTLGEELRTAVEGVQLPPACAQAFTRVRTSHDALRAAFGDRLPKPVEKTVSGRAADRRVDAIYRGLFDWCRGLSKLPEDLAPGVAAKAIQIGETMFPDGLTFTQMAYKLEWAQSQARIDSIDTKNLTPLFTALGGDVFVTAIRTAHADYGKALGVTEAKPEPAAPPEIREPLDAFVEALRSYVVQVVAHADATGSDGQALADKLLGPLAQWHLPGGGATEGEGDGRATPTSPTSGPTPSA